MVWEVLVHANSFELVLMVGIVKKVQLDGCKVAMELLSWDSFVFLKDAILVDAKGKKVSWKMACQDTHTLLVAKSKHLKALCFVEYLENVHCLDFNCNLCWL